MRTSVQTRRIRFCVWMAGWTVAMGTVSAATTVTGLCCEDLEDPLGIDVTQPRLSWRIESDQRGQRQTAYQVCS